MRKRALVCGAGGFIGHHLVKRLKNEGYWVRGVDIKQPDFSESSADEFLILDLRDPDACKMALRPVTIEEFKFDEVYQLAADMGGMGFIHSAECEIMYNSTLVNLHMINTCAELGIKRYFFSSSACVYADMNKGDSFVDETFAYPAAPDNEYGWEKLYAERVAQAYARRFGIEVRIARFQNCYGPEGTWSGGREKAPAALCRKIAQARAGEQIEIWGDGKAMRSYTYVSDMVDGILMLMKSEICDPINIGSDEFVSVNELAEIIIRISGKELSVKHIDGPVGVLARNHLFDRIKSLGWRSEYDLKSGLAKTYNWIRSQVEGEPKQVLSEVHAT
jgi:nucleoside-diphosphate-sugar epimerase